MYPSSALGEFLRSRRARLQPTDVGLGNGFRHRRVAGLRREELAPLAGVSVGYYTRLEQGQSPNVSAEVLDALARVLRLDETEQAHLHRLARAAHAREAVKPEVLRPGIRRMVESFADVPAWAVGRRADVLTRNELAQTLFTPHLHPDEPLNFVRFDFLDPVARDSYVDWPAKARDDIAYLQTSLGRFPGDQGLTALIDEMRAISPEFEEIWHEQPVSNCATVTRGHRHPEYGVLTLTSEMLRVPDDEGQGVVLFQAEPGSPEEGLLARLRPA